MSIDVIALVLLLLAVYRGFRKGLIAALFSVAGVVLALAAAMKLSATVAVWLGNEVSVHARWLPVLAFLLVFLSVMLLVRMLAAIVEKGFELAMLGWANQLAGIVIYILMYGLIFSTILFFVTRLGLLSDASVSSSVVYPYLQPWAPATFEFVSAIMPFLKDVFTQLQEFFEKVSETPSPATVKGW